MKECFSQSFRVFIFEHFRSELDFNYRTYDWQTLTLVNDIQRFVRNEMNVEEPNQNLHRLILF